MKYHYTAYFYPSEDGKDCQVIVPALDIDIEFRDMNEQECLRAIQQEAEDMLSVYEYDGITPPPDVSPESISEGNSFVLEIDTDKGKREIRRVYIG